MNRPIARIVDRVRTSPFAVSVAALSGGSAAGALISLGVAPAISRLYSPAEFGALGIYTSTLLLVSVVAALRYDLAIPSAPDEEEAASILVVALTTIGCTTLVCAVALISGAWRLVPSLRDSFPARLIWWVPFGMVATGSYAALSSWIVRRQDFRTLGSTKVAQGALMTGSQLALGLAQVGTTGLIVGQVAGSSAGLVRLARRIKQLDGSLFVRIPPQRVLFAARKYRRFPLLSAPAALLDSLTGVLPLLFVAAAFGAASAGQLTLVQRVLVAPLALLTTNLGQVVFGDLAKLSRTDSRTMLALFYRRLAQVARLGTALVVAMAFAVPLVLPVLFGARWAQASTYFLLLSPMLLANFVSAPFGFVIDVLRRQDLHLLRDSTRTLVMILALQIATTTSTSWTHTIALISVAGTVNGIIYLSVSWYAVSHHVKAHLLEAVTPPEFSFTNGEHSPAYEA